MDIGLLGRRLCRFAAGIMALSLLAAAPAAARSGGIKYAADYSDVRGFNYNTVSSRGYADQWNRYDHAEVDRQLGYAERIRLNMARVFLAYGAWKADPARFRANIRDFVRTAYGHHIGTMFVLIDGPQGLMPDPFGDGAKPEMQAYVKDVAAAVGDEPGLVMWDAGNEPDWVRLPAAPPNTNQPQRVKLAMYVAAALRQFDKVTPVTIGCEFLTCAEQTAPVVNVLSFHDYSQTRAQIVADIQRGQAMAARFGKPIITTEMGCVGRANPYDIEIEEHDKAHMGWMIWELMIARAWGNVHGIFYDDGTIRDPSLVAAVLGFYRNRGTDIVMEQSDREGITSGVLQDAHKWLADAKASWFDGMVIAETMANTLEAAQLVGMRDPPTRKVELLRAGNENMPALKLLVEEFIAELSANATPGQAPMQRYYTPPVAH
jgi:hypothetical protein